MTKILTGFEFVLLYRMILAAICGLAVGYERKYHLKSAGVKTHVIVSLASALMMEVSKYGFSDLASGDGSRVAAQVVSGISFLGAGIIIKRNQNVEGLTTAAGIWMMSGIGLAVGAGMYGIGCACTALYILFNFCIRFLEKRYKTYQESYLLRTDSAKTVQWILQSCKEGKIVENSVKKDEDSFAVALSVLFPDRRSMEIWEIRMLSDAHVDLFERQG